jgi:signal transduction histidine kinase
MQASPAVVAVYNAVSTLNDLTTAIILFGQFNILRSRALLLLASGYLFASLISIIQLLTFSDMFTPTGLLGAGPQTALWLCVFWHGGFPLVVIFYALFQGDGWEIVTPPRIAMTSAVTVVIGVVLACWFAATWGAENARVLPPLLDRTGFTPWQRVVNLTDIILVLGALVLLSARPRHSLLNLWLMVVMGYWFCDITLSSYLNGGRYDLGFYAGRIYGALAASFVLAVLVLENSRLYRRLAIAASRLKERATELLRANETLQSEIAYRERAEEGLRQAQAELARVSRMTAMGELTSSLADEVNHPIGAIMMNAETCLRWLSHEVPNVERARTIASMIVTDGTRASEVVTRMQQLFDKGAARVGRHKRCYSRDDRSFARRGCAIRRVDPHRVDGQSFSGRRRSHAIKAGSDESHDQRHRGNERRGRDTGTHHKVAASGQWTDHGVRQRYRRRTPAAAGKSDFQCVLHHETP